MRINFLFGEMLLRWMGVIFWLGCWGSTGQLVEGQTRIFGTWYGGTGYDYIERNGVALAADGSVVLAGNTQSMQGVATPATHKTQITNTHFRDAFIARFSPQGQRQCATYYGGDNDELAMDLALNEQGDVYVVGATGSHWPAEAIATPGSAQVQFGGGKLDAFMVKLDRNCRRVAGTYFGGPGVNGDGAYGVALGRDGIYVAGWTDSASGIASAGAYQTLLRGGYDAFLVKLNLLNHRVIWATYYGGQGYDVAHTVRLAEDGHVYIAGITTSSEYIALPGSHQQSLAGGTDIFVAKFHPFNGQLLAGTYVGGEKDEGAMNHVALALTKNDYLYVLSDTYSSTGIATADAPIQSRGNQPDLDVLDLFLVKLKQSDLKRIWGSYLGFKNIEGIGVMTLGPDESIYVGLTSSGADEPYEYTFQTTPGYGILAKYRSQNAQPLWITYFDAPIKGLAVNTNDEIAIAGAHNSTATRSGLPINVVSENAHQKDIAGNFDAFVAKFSNLPPPPRIVAPDQVIGYVGHPIQPVQFRNNSGRVIRWNVVGLPEGLSIDPNQGIVNGTPQHSGIYNVLITAENTQGTSRFTSVFKIYARPELRGPEVVILKINEAMAPIVALNTGGQADEWILRDKPTWMQFDPRTGQINGIPNELGTFTVYLTARNPVGASTQKIDFIVQSALPLITSPLSATGVQGNPFTYLLQAENATFLEVHSLPANLTFNPTTRTISGTPSTPGTYSIPIIARNSHASSETTLHLTILPPPPTITSPTQWIIPQNQAVTFTITTNPPANRITAFGLPSGLSINEQTGLIQGLTSTTGTFSVNITAENAGGHTNQNLTIQVTPSNKTSPPIAPPRILAPDSITGILGTAFGFAINTEGDVTRYDAQDLPPGLTVNPNTGYILGIPQQIGTFEVKLIATNPAGTTTKPLTITINNQTIAIFSNPIPTRSTTPTLPTPASTPNLGPSTSHPTTPNPSPASTSPTPTQPPKPSTTPKSPQRPPEKSPNTPPSTSPNLATPKTDLPNTQAQITSDKKTSPAPAAPTTIQILSPSTAPGTVGQNFTYAISAQGPVTSYAVRGTLPEGLQLNETTGIISGTPTAPGTHHITIQASSDKANSSKTLTITITAPPPPQITSPTTATGYIDTPFTYTIRATGNPTYQIQGNLPDGLTLDQSTGIISGTPQKTSRHPITLIASNPSGRAEKDLLIEILKAPPPEITTPAILSATVHIPFQHTIQANKPILTYLLESPLPDGLQFDVHTGLLHGTPQKPGRHTLLIKAINEAGTTPHSLTLRILPLPQPLITSAKTARASLHRPFHYPIRTNFKPQRFAILEPLPVGLQFNETTGIISGTPQVSGTFTLTLQAISENQKAQATLTLFIHNLQPIRHRPAPDNLNELVADPKPAIASLYRP